MPTTPTRRSWPTCKPGRMGRRPRHRPSRSKARSKDARMSRRGTRTPKPGKIGATWPTLTTGPTLSRPRSTWAWRPRRPRRGGRPTSGGCSSRPLRPSMHGGTSRGRRHDRADDQAARRGWRAGAGMTLPVPYYTEPGITLYCGDAREILPLLKPVDMIFTDPPFGHNNNNGDLIHRWESALGRGPHGASRAISNDGGEANALIQWFFQAGSRLLSPGDCCCCCCCGGGPDPQFARWSLWMDEVYDFKQMVVWDKGPMGMG